MLIETKLSPAIGSRIENIDVRHLDTSSVMAVRDAFLRRGMLVFPEQNLVGQEVARFALLFGEIWVSKILKGLPDAPGVFELTNYGKEAGLTEYWHHDSTYSARPPAITVLSAQEVPQWGGDTLWCSQYEIFDSLSPAMQQMLRGLKAVHYDRHRNKQVEGSWRANTDEHTAHPVVRTHPETGRQALFIGGQAEHFEGMTREESHSLLTYLLGLLGRPDASYRHRWQPGDLLIWDNRCTCHYAVHDYGTSERVMHRVTIQGEVPALHVLGDRCQER